ncbi:filamentous hemagglutinin family N-terminal domain protein [Leptolyngbya sp. PCC 7375]|nr:filamentous hemagglutinin family N-terminal domain protein [Leptolyngbya sp. PCC 7375]
MNVAIRNLPQLLIATTLVNFLGTNQVQAQIEPDDTLGLDTSVINTIQEHSSTYLITGGTSQGTNLFHSFQEFNVNEGQIVFFSNPEGIEMILSRVTGNNASNIFGRLGVKDSANLFLLNPNGIVFGPGAELYIGGSFTASTAESVQFSDGGEFSVTEPGAGSLLSIDLDVPLGIQFDTTSQENIQNVGVLETGQDLMLTGNNLYYSSAGQLLAGQDLGLQAQGTVIIRDMETETFIARSEDKLTVQGNQGIDIVANIPETVGGTYFIADTGEELSGGSIVVSSINTISSNGVNRASISLTADGSITISGNLVSAGQSLASNADNGGDIVITSESVDISIVAESGNILVDDNITLSSNTNIRNAGDGGDILLSYEPEEILIDGERTNALTFSSHGDTGVGGNLSASSGSIKVPTNEQPSLFLSTSNSNAGNGGIISIPSASSNIAINENLNLSLDSDDTSSEGNIVLQDHELVDVEKLISIATEHSYFGNYSEAIKLYQQSLLISQKHQNREHQNRVQEGQIHANLGNTFLATRNFTKAIEHYHQSLMIFQELDNPSGEGQILRSLGNVHLSLGQYEQAIELYQKSLSIAQDIGNPYGEGEILSNLGNVYLSLGQYEQAIELYQKSLSIAQDIGNPYGEGRIISNLGNVFLATGNFYKAISFYQQSLTILREQGDHLGEGQALANLGSAYLSLGKYDKAIELYEQSLSIAQEVGNRRGEGQILGNLGNLYSLLGDYNRAIELYEQSLSIAQEVVNRHNVGQTLGNLGNLFFDIGDLNEALAFHQKSLKIMRELGDHLGEGQALTNLGNTYSSLGEYDEAIAFHQQSLFIAQEIGNRSLEGQVLNNLGLVFLKSNNLLEAEEKFYQAIEVWESVRQYLGKNDSWKISIFDEQAKTYSLIQETLLAQSKFEEALEISERGRARAFVELLSKGLSTQSLASDHASNLSIQEIKEIASSQQATLVQYSIITKEQQSTTSQGQLAIWVIHPNGKIYFRSVDLNSHEFALDEMITSAHTSLNPAVRRGSNISDELQFAPGDSVRLIDDLPDWELWEVLSVNMQTSTLTLRLPSWEDKSISIERPSTDVIGTEKSHSQTFSSLQKLHSLMIEPISDLLPDEQSSHVVFIPQGPLFLVPFAALQDDKGDYLIEQHTIRTAPSLQVLSLTQQQQHASSITEDALIVGNPVMPEVSWLSEENDYKLPSLPSAEWEAIEIAQSVGTKPLIANQATESAVTQRLSQASLIHLATHGLLDDTDALNSAIALAPSENDDGFLRASELLNLELRAQLVVLSACETGVGEITGDGVVGLSRSFISAGVPSVIVSLWAVPDSSTAELMIDFYRNLQEDMDKAQALRQAMLNTMQKYPNPIDWAAFTLIGDAS